jgi:hypothetical protein
MDKLLSDKEYCKFCKEFASVIDTSGYYCLEVFVGDFIVALYAEHSKLKGMKNVSYVQSFSL